MAEEDADALDLQLGPDVFDAVVVASFGGVQVSLPLSDDRFGLNDKPATARRSITVHPFLVWCVASLLFFMQVTCLTCLILDIDFKKKWATDSWEEFDKTPGKRILLCSKTLMVIVLQMICLREFLAAMKPLAFIVNPITWREVWRPSSDKPKLFHALVCVPVCFMAELFQFIIAYTVAASSMTIILQSDHVTDVVFNGLVITFLTDLDEYMFTAAAAVFHVDVRKYNNFQFKFNRSAEDERAAATNTWKRWLYRGRGGKVQLVENCVVFGFVGLMLLRQVFVFTQAIDTGVLPLKRDFCTLFRGLDGPYVDSTHGDNMGAMLVFVMNGLTLLDYRKSLENCAIRWKVTDCYHSDVRPLDMTEDVPRYFKEYPRFFPLACIIVVAVFLVPQLLYANHVKILDFFEDKYAKLVEEEMSSKVMSSAPFIDQDCSKVDEEALTSRS